MAIDAALGFVAVLLATAVLGVAVHRTASGIRLVYALCSLASVGLVVVAATQLLSPAAEASVRILPIGLPWIGARFKLDVLTAFFQVVVNVAAAATSAYAIGYGTHESSPGRVLPFYAAFLAGMNLVLIADDAFVFLVAWEVMSLMSWALVVAHHHDAENTRAGYIYIVMASFGTLALLMCFGLLAGAGGAFGFSEIRAMPHAGAIVPVALVLVLIGAGSKAGLVPLHVWLPLAHPAAPSHVSALMSGVMTKVAIYGFMRIVFDLLGPPAWWWSLPVLVLGSITAVLGVLQSLMQRDLKRLLAYSTVENVGIVFIGLGLALAFKANGMAGAAALACTAALFHALNHALFKSLLFMGAGAVLAGTGLRDIERLGGLIHTMPRTAVLFLGGCVALAALPPLNGFVSEWLLLQAILLSPNLPQWALKIIVPASGAMLALAAALAATTVSRAFGIAFLGRPRSDAARTAHDADAFSQAGMAALLVICFLAGTLPGFVVDGLSRVVTVVAGQAMPSQASLPWLTIVPIAESRSSYNGLLVFLFILSTTLAAVVLMRWLARGAIRRAPAWDCGFPDPSPVTQYTADSFAQPVRRVFGDTLLDAREKVVMPAPGDPRPAHLDVRLRDLVWDFAYAPISGAVLFVAEKLNYLQFLTIRRFLSLVFAALIALLVVVAAWR